MAYLVLILSYAWKCMLFILQSSSVKNSFWMLTISHTLLRTRHRKLWGLVFSFQTRANQYGRQGHTRYRASAVTEEAHGVMSLGQRGNVSLGGSQTSGWTNFHIRLILVSLLLIFQLIAKKVNKWAVDKCPGSYKSKLLWRDSCVSGLFWGFSCKWQTGILGAIDQDMWASPCCLA